MRRGMMAWRMGAAAALLAVMASLETPLAGGAGVDGSGEEGDLPAALGGRRLRLISAGLSLAQRLAEAIASGNIDEAARILVETVRNGDSESVIQGLFQSRSRPGIAQTILRAFGLGLGGRELLDVVKRGSDGRQEASEVLQEVMFLVDGTAIPATQTPDVEYVVEGTVAEPPAPTQQVINTPNL
ncbi:unnamed protein product [Ostreobium quekettii]|uniref:Uncharacterized protein n=1 Tax=Ostreobium quekettii TaxID=121088 RepID=A0A8S1JER1_9CHLO|nr:unnamed protein product [Ostreobium quekettii]